MVVIWRSVNSRGCSPVSMAAFSAGSPNESHPIGDSTFLPRHPVIAGEQIDVGVVPQVTHVEFARGIRIHLNVVELGSGRVFGDVEDTLPFPEILPFQFYGPEVVRHGRMRVLAGLNRKR